MPANNSKIHDLAQFQFKNSATVKEFISLIPLNNNDLVLEIGPGLGAITKILTPLCKDVIAIECDLTCKETLNEIGKQNTNLHLVWQDFLTYSLPKTPYKIISNIPFNLTRKILQKIVTSENIPSVFCLVLQTEVSEKICRKDNEHSLLSAYIQNFYHLKIIKTFQRHDYHPPAHVDTVALLMEMKQEAPLLNKNDFFQFLSTSFDSPGQPLKSRLKKHFTFNQLKKISANLKINLDGPPHLLSSKNWLNLFELYQKLN